VRSRASPATSPARPPVPVFYLDGVNRFSRALGSSFSLGSGPSSIRRAQAIPGLPGHARGLRTKETRAKRRGKFPRVVWLRLVGERGQSSSSSSRLPCIVVFPAHRLPRAVKAAADGRPATRRGELMPARQYIAAYRAWLATFASISPNRPLHLLHPPPPGEQWRATDRTRTARPTTDSAGAPCTSGRAGCCTRRATWRRRTSARPKDGA
jgi:hypothetical protein